MSNDTVDDKEIIHLLQLCEEICRYLANQRGMIPKDYAKDLAKQIEKTRRVCARPIQDNRTDSRVIQRRSD